MVEIPGGNIFQYLLSGAGALLLFTSSLLMKNLITKLDEGNKILTQLRIDMAVIRGQFEIHDKRAGRIEEELDQLANDVRTLKTGTYCSNFHPPRPN